MEASAIIQLLREAIIQLFQSKIGSTTCCAVGISDTSTNIISAGNKIGSSSGNRGVSILFSSIVPLLFHCFHHRRHSNALPRCMQQSLPLRYTALLHYPQLQLHLPPFTIKAMVQTMAGTTLSLTIATTNSSMEIIAYRSSIRLENSTVHPCPSLLKKPPEPVIVLT